MEAGNRISANSRTCSRRRVHAKKRERADGLANIMKKLQRREISTKPDRSFGPRNAEERFRHFRLQEVYDIFDPKENCFNQERSKIIEIVSAGDVVFALARSGLCAAYSRETNQRLCFMNGSLDEAVKTLFYNRSNDSLITVSIYASDDLGSLKCRSTRLEYIKRGEAEAGFALFESELLDWPGFVEFDDINKKLLTYSAHSRLYKLFDMKNYTFLYSILDDNVEEIKISPGIMLLIFERASSHVHLKILSIEDGTVLKSFNQLLHLNKKLEFIEEFNEKLLVKQKDENLQIIDVRDSQLMEVSRNEFITPSAFTFLYENKLFLTFQNRTIAVRNFRGELVTSFEDHMLFCPVCDINNIYITSDQDLIISYCKSDSEGSSEEENVGSIIVSDIFTGQCLAKINASSMGKMTGSLKFRSTVAEALSNITALYYDEDRNEIYTGNRQGLLHVWSN